MVRETVIYDSDCRLCEGTRRWVERWDRRGRLEFFPLRDPRLAERFPAVDPEECERAIHFVDTQGRVTVGPEAVRDILRRLPGGRPLARLLGLPGIYPLARKLYDWIADHRYRLFGRTNH
jgi:predicted DCC family thiol-disulfide oxidoreductase YuxK